MELTKLQQAYSKLVFLCDANTKIHCLPFFADFVAKYKIAIIEVEAGEGNKNLGAVKLIWEAMINLELDRSALLLNLGGGMLSDLGGFAASCYKRGIDFVNIPTTFLSQIDASFGGKTAINLGSTKNQIGSFVSPVNVLVCPLFLKTLADRETKNGFAEAFKHALIADRNYWDFLLDLNIFDFNRLDWKPIILLSFNIKMKIVNLDPKEEGIRKLLNFGHTLGHAFEAFANRKTEGSLSHGEAVAAGIICESYISMRLLNFPASAMDDICRRFNHFFDKLDFIDEKNTPAFFDLMRHDKKNQKGKINFSLIEEIGKARFDCEVSDELIKESIQYYSELN
jgi:3-dehydroquinate synthase